MAEKARHTTTRSSPRSDNRTEQCQPPTQRYLLLAAHVAHNLLVLSSRWNVLPRLPKTSSMVCQASSPYSPLSVLCESEPIETCNRRSIINLLEQSSKVLTRFAVSLETRIFPMCVWLAESSAMLSAGDSPWPISLRGPHLWWTYWRIVKAMSEPSFVSNHITVFCERCSQILTPSRIMSILKIPLFIELHLTIAGRACI